MLTIFRASGWTSKFVCLFQVDHEIFAFSMQAACGDPNFCTGKLSGNYCDGQYVKVPLMGTGSSRLSRSNILA